MNISTILNLRQNVLTKGDVGIEIELEGDNLPSGEQVHPYWRREHDGSLRPSPDAAEYVFRKPLKEDKAKEALGVMSEKFRELNTTDCESGRAGVHVHVNCQQLMVHELANFICLYLVMEDLLVRFCGDDRVGNLFCLRAADAEYLITSLHQAFSSQDLTQLNSDEFRYASMNVKSLFQYGSLEFRAMRSTLDMQVIEQWMGILLRLREAAKEYEDPCHIMFSISNEGPNDFCRRVLGDYADSLIDLGGCEFEVMQNMRNIQDIAYLVDWEHIKSPKKMIGGVEFPETFEDDFPLNDL